MRIKIFHDIVNAFGNVSNKKGKKCINISAVVAVVAVTHDELWPSVIS